MSKTEGVFIVLSGPDGSGKSTQVTALTEALRKKFGADRVVQTREPGGSAFAEKIRGLILSDAAETASPISKLLLFFAARKDHREAVIDPALAAGKIVISDRFDIDTYAYQCVAEGGSHWKIRQAFFDLQRLMVSDIHDSSWKQLYLIINVDRKVARLRLAGRMEKQNYFDKKGPEFQERVRRGFEEYAATHPNCCIIDGNGTAEVVHLAIMAEVEKLF